MKYWQLLARSLLGSVTMQGGTFPSCHHFHFSSILIAPGGRYLIMWRQEKKCSLLITAHQVCGFSLYPPSVLPPDALGENQTKKILYFHRPGFPVRVMMARY